VVVEAISLSGLFFVCQIGLDYLIFL